jgi:superfamily II DNA or RNA helicase
MATGVGKTKPAIDEMMELYTFYEASVDSMLRGDISTTLKRPFILLVTVTEEMRDVNWSAEVKHWYGEEGTMMWSNFVHPICYQSLHKHKAMSYDLIIFDEIHHLTWGNAEAFFNGADPNKLSIMGLTADYPNKKDDEVKWDLLNQVAPLVFTYKLDQGVEDGVVRPFDFHIVQIPLDKVHKNIEAGPAKKRYMTTEADRYKTWSNAIKAMYAKKNTKGADVMVMRRMHFLYNLPSKMKVAREVIVRLCRWETLGSSHANSPRTLVFCGSIKQANELFGENVYHSKAKAKKGQKSALDRFREEELSTLGVVSAVNEGINIPNLDQEIIIQMDSKELTLSQRIGRTVRWRDVPEPAQVWILVSIGTQDEEWLNKALTNFDKSRVFYHSHTEFDGTT